MSKTTNRTKCISCGEIKHNNAFIMDSDLVRQKVCKRCITKQNKMSGQFRYLGQWSFQKNKPTELELIQTFRVLKALGYDLEQDIHDQFCDRHSLEPREKPDEESLYLKKDILKLL